MAYIRERPSKKKGIVYCIADGKKTITLKARTLKEAREYLKEYEWEKATHKPISLLLKNITFNELAEEYSEFAKVSKTALTWNRDKSVIKYLCKDIGSLQVGKIDATVIEKLQNKWRAMGNGKGIPNSNKTINQKSILLGTILRYAIKKKYLIDLPPIPKYKVDKRPPNWFSQTEMDTILRNADPFLRNYLLVLLHSGMRAGELRSLQWSNVDFQNKVLCLEKTKSHSFRKVPMNKSLLTLLQALYHARTPKQVYVFEYFEGKPVNDFYHKFKRLLNKLGIEGYLHKIRHTCATYLANDPEVSIYAVRELLGHASVTTTERYAHVRAESLRNAVEKLPVFSTQDDHSQNTVKSEKPNLRIA